MNRRDFLLQLSLTAFFVNEDSDPKLVMTQAAAYRIEEIEPLLTKRVVTISPAPSGRWVLLEQDLRTAYREFGEQKIWLYDTQRHKLTMLHHLQDTPEAGTYM
ncbi:hypothetical protein, partial [Armatimonas sp.]|uniref:hypothetical protein n=1 Tax=Armatimonas sp. TaxID=1872638 RepID=UPI00286C30FB